MWILAPKVTTAITRTGNASGMWRTISTDWQTREISQQISLQTALEFIFLAHFATFIKFKLSSWCFVPGLVKIKCSRREQNGVPSLHPRFGVGGECELSSQPLEGISPKIDLFFGLRTLCAKWFASAGIFRHLASMESRQATPSAADKAEEAFKIPRLTYLILMAGPENLKSSLTRLTTLKPRHR